MLKAAHTFPINGADRAKINRYGFSLSHLAPIGEGSKPWLDGEKRRINHRWLYGTIITGAAGSFLMGVAVWGSIEKGATDRQHAQMVPVITLEQKQTRFVEKISNTSRKADKLSIVQDAFVSAKQTIRVSSSVKVGDKEVVKVRPYTKVSTNLVTSSTERSNDVPAFNPVKLMSGEAAVLEASDDTSGDISIANRDLTPSNLDQAIFIVANSRDILDKVRELSTSLAISSNALALPGSNPFGFGDNAKTLSIVEKTPMNRDNSAQPSDRLLTAKDGDTVVSLLIEAGVSRDDARAIATAFNRTGQDLSLKLGQRLRLVFARAKSGVFQAARISLYNDARETTVALADDGRYLNIDTTKAKKSADDEEEEEGGMKIYNALYETALKQEMPKKTIDEMIRIFSYDIDFNKPVTEGDTIDVFYGTEDEGERGDVLYAALKTDGEMRKYYRFQAGDDGTLDYYDEKGKSAKKFLIRKPMQDGVFRSPFGMRRHPIYGNTRMHSGVDWSARSGTPIIAAGNGTIDFLGRQSGYGNRIELVHSNGYTTTYSHISRFAKGMEEGKRVTQGQVIAFVGSTGASTGPHLHYEVMVNGSYVDPLRVRVPKGRELEGASLAEFNKEKARIDALLNRKDGLQRVGQLN